jgi:hypothetical protein
MPGGGTGLSVLVGVVEGGSGLAVQVVEGVIVTVCVDVEVAEADGVTDGEGVSLDRKAKVTVGIFVALGGTRVRVAVRVLGGEAVAVGRALGVNEGVLVGGGLGDRVKVGVGVRVNEAVRVAVGDGGGVREAVALAVGVGDAVWVGVGGTASWNPTSALLLVEPSVAAAITISVCTPSDSPAGSSTLHAPSSSALVEAIIPP